MCRLLSGRYVPNMTSRWLDHTSKFESPAMNAVSAVSMSPSLNPSLVLHNEVPSPTSSHFISNTDYKIVNSPTNSSSRAPLCIKKPFNGLHETPRKTAPIDACSMYDAPLQGDSHEYCSFENKRINEFSTGLDENASDEFMKLHNHQNDQDLDFYITGYPEEEYDDIDRMNTNNETPSRSHKLKSTHDKKTKSCALTNDHYLQPRSQVIRLNKFSCKGKINRTRHKCKPSNIKLRSRSNLLATEMANLHLTANRRGSLISSTSTNSKSKVIFKKIVKSISTPINSKISHAKI